ncbi:type II secretion system F family protein [bacterium]|nr:type II secretion system F family protein [bacterium]
MSSWSFSDLLQPFSLGREMKRARALLGEERGDDPFDRDAERSSRSSSRSETSHRTKDEGHESALHREKNPRGEGGPLAGLHRKELFRYAGLRPQERERYLLFLTGSFLVALLFTLALDTPLFFLLPVVIYLLQHHTLQQLIASRQANFDRDYAALLLSLSSGLKTGLDPLVALCRAAELFQPDSVLREELHHFEQALTDGDTEDDAIDRFGYTVRHPDIKLFRMAFKLARREGASLSLCLQRLARVTRARQSFRRKSRGAVATQKLSAFGIAGCTVLIGGIQGFSNTTAFLEACSHPTGRVVIAIGVGLVVIGIGWMLRMSQLKV